MTTTRFQKFSLFIAGVTAFCIGASILTIPRVFYGSYGIILADDPSLLSELRAPGAGLAVLGAVMLDGVPSGRTLSHSFRGRIFRLAACRECMVIPFLKAQGIGLSTGHLNKA